MWRQVCEPPRETPARSLLNDGGGELLGGGPLAGLGGGLGVLGVGQRVVLEAAQLVVVAAVALHPLLVLQGLVGVAGDRRLQQRLFIDLSIA